MINKLPLLKYLDVNKCIQIGNPMLETALSAGQTIEIFCEKTSVNTYEFNSKHRETEVFSGKKKITNAEFESLQFVCQRLTFWC